VAFQRGGNETVTLQPRRYNVHVQAGLFAVFLYILLMMTMVMMMIRLQTEAALLRGVMSAGLSTKVIVLGIGVFLDEAELHGMASPPTDSTVIIVPDFSSLQTVEVQLRDATCDRTCHSLSCYIYLPVCISNCLSEHFSKQRKICFLYDKNCRHSHQGRLNVGGNDAKCDIGKVGGSENFLGPLSQSRYCKTDRECVCVCK